MEEEDNLKPSMSIETALDLFNRENYCDSIAVIKYYADEGNNEACSIVGLAYHLGLGVSVDIEAAIKYLTIAAESGLGIAAHNLGSLYATLPKMDIENSKYWFDVARKRGFDPST